MLTNTKAIRPTLTFFKVILSKYFPMHITYFSTYSSVETEDMHRYIDNSSNITLGGSCHSAHYAVSRFTEDHIVMVS